MEEQGGGGESAAGAGGDSALLRTPGPGPRPTLPVSEAEPGGLQHQMGALQEGRQGWMCG